MCIIIIKRKGFELPNKDILRNCFLNNPDGSGIAYNDGQVVHLKKGLMTFNNFMNMLNEISKPKDRDILMHFRIATQGEISPAMCHPFPISADINTLRNLSGVYSKVLAHNGVLSGYADNILSDTAGFIRILAKIGNTGDIQKLIKNTSGKFALITGNRVFYSGDYINKNGILYSNSSYNIYYDELYVSKYFYNHKPYKNKKINSVICDICYKDIDISTNYIINHGSPVHYIRDIVICDRCMRDCERTHKVDICVVCGEEKKRGILVNISEPDFYGFICHACEALINK